MLQKLLRIQFGNYDSTVITIAYGSNRRTLHLLQCFLSFLRQVLTIESERESARERDREREGEREGRRGGGERET